MDIGYNWIASGVRLKTQKTRQVGDVTLRKTFGRNYHRWVGRLSDFAVIFTPTLGRYNGKVNGWKWSTQVPTICGHYANGRERYLGGSANSLHNAVVCASAQAVQARRIANGLPALTDYED